ncbi:MAG TPA: IS21 family transposase, partial [Thermoleophilaceae bacterium]|nr:IS21 family transposase [Thermoleophilaceae bacterium]
APRKQRHTAKRIWERLRDEHAADVAERTVREYVHRRRRERGEGVEAFVPQVHHAGMEAEADWGEAHADVGGQRTKLYLFHMRACHSGAAFAMVFPHCSQQAFLEGHVEAFDWFGGVFGLVRYDNLTSAVKQVLRGRRRVETDRFIALRSHYLYESKFTIPGIEGAHEKGGVEGEVGRFRRRHLVPVPQVATLGELNARMLAGCDGDLGRRIVGRQETVGESFARERPLLRALPAEPAQTAEDTTPRVDAKSLVTIKQNRYSVPVRLAGLRINARVGAREIELRHRGEQVARHERLQGRFGTSAQLDHYLELLQRKPGAFEGSTALWQERERGAWPACFDELWAAIAGRYGASEAARQMVDVIMLAREHGPAQAELAVRGALAAGAHDGRAVGVLARRAQRAHAPALDDLPDRLKALDSPEPTLTDYDQLLSGGGSR